jgi:hypothetical protein
MARFAPVALAFAMSLALPTAQAQPAEALEQARALLATYIARSQAFDPTLAELYSDQAHIENLRTYPTGEVRQLTFPAAQYKALIEKAMPLARSRGDTNRYSQPQFSAHGRGVRIAMTRHSELKNYSSPLVLVVGRETDGRWRILEERSESRP